MTDREVQAISQFLLKFGHLGCHQVIVCRPTREVKKLSRDQIGQAVLDIREAWKREGLSTAPTSRPACPGAVGPGVRSTR